MIMRDFYTKEYNLEGIDLQIVKTKSGQTQTLRAPVRDGRQHGTVQLQTRCPGPNLTQAVGNIMGLLDTSPD